MFRCAHCSTHVVFGGRQEEGLRFCSKHCAQYAPLIRIGQQFKDAEVAQYLGKLHRGPCPQCSGPGPVDVHKSYWVWSLAIYTSVTHKSLTACGRCGFWHKLKGTLFTLVFGWWAIPFGWFVTLIRSAQNLWSLLSPPDPTAPSEALRDQARLRMAADQVNALQRAVG